MSCQPLAVPASLLVIAPVRTVAPQAAATAGGSDPSPLASVVKTGPAGRSSAAGSSDPAAAASERCRCAACARPGQRGLERQFLRSARVDAAEQRIHQPVHDFAAEPGADVIGHRHIAVALGGRQPKVTACPGQSGRGQDPGSRQLVQVGGHAHELAFRQRLQLAAGPDAGGRGAGQHQLIGQADRADQVGALGAAGQQRLRALVDRDPGDLGYRELAAQSRRALQHGHGGASVAQEERGGQPGDPAAHDRHGRPLR